MKSQISNLKESVQDINKHLEALDESSLNDVMN